MNKSEPWYIHAALWVVIVILSYILIRVAIIDPTEYVAQEKHFKQESRLRMNNLRQAEILYAEKYDRFSGSIDSLKAFVKSDTSVINLMNGVDSLSGKSTNPFKVLANGTFNFDSLYATPKSFSPYILQVDTTVNVDTIINRRGRITSIDTSIVIGTKYFIKDPDGYGSIGSLSSAALKNTASWE